MPAYRHGNRWRYRKWVQIRDGRKIRVGGTPAINTKQAAEAAERAHIERVLDPARAAIRKEVPTFKEFAEIYLEVATTQHARPRSGGSYYLFWLSKTPRPRLHYVGGYCWLRRVDCDYGTRCQSGFRHVLGDFG